VTGAAGFPRVVAHRGLSGVCPENTLPAFAAAIVLGAHEIELDLWGSKDRQLIVCHDPTVDRTSNGRGAIRDLTWAEIQRLDAGAWFGEGWSDVGFARLDEVFCLLPGSVDFNLHLKEPGDDGWILRDVADLAASCGLRERIYFAGEKDVLEWAVRTRPDVPRCCLDSQRDGRALLQRTIEFECARLQFWSPYFSRDLIAEAHARGIRCNLFYADTADEARKCLDAGIDAILTNYANRILPLVPPRP
jgi:glycerophosphoryl diester phosphodiesterase